MRSRQGVTINGLPLLIRPVRLAYMDIENLDWYYEDCVVGGPGSFMIPVRGPEAFIEATRTKLVLDIASAPQLNPAGAQSVGGEPAYLLLYRRVALASAHGRMMAGVIVRVCLALVVALGAAAPARADGSPPPIIEGQARVLPVLARNGMVVAQEGIAARVGVEILKRGGNAVDAAVATGFALAVTLPRAGNLGGGGFMLIRLAKEQKTVALDYRETAPAATTPDVFLDAQGQADPAKSRDSGLAVGVPGTVAGLTYAHAHYGSGKFTLADLIAPAIALAQDGIIVEDDLANSLLRTHAVAALRFVAAYFPASGWQRLRARRASGAARSRGNAGGHRRAMGRAPFTRAAIAEKIIDAVRTEGGRMTPADLAGYRPVERQALGGMYRGHEIISMPPPSSGGVHLIELLNVLEGYDLASLGAGSADAIQIEAEAMKIAFADRAEYLGDPAFITVPVSSLISKKYAAELRAGISLDRARPAADVRRVDPGAAGRRPDHAFLRRRQRRQRRRQHLHVELFLWSRARRRRDRNPSQQRTRRLRRAARRAERVRASRRRRRMRPGPGKRPLSSMTPTIVLKDGKVELVTGSPGGPRIITTVLGMVLDVIDFGMNIAEATDAPRVHHQWLPDELRVERGLSPDTLRLLRAKGQNVSKAARWGRPRRSHVRDGWLMGAADTRQRGTLAAGY